MAIRACYLPSLLFACGLGAILGCGGPSYVETEHVEGVVTVDGDPVAEATVTFKPVTEGQGLPAVGITDDQGRYELTATVTGDERGEIGGGTTPGEYQVGVIRNEVETPMSGEEAEEAGVEDYEVPEQRDGPQITYVVPQKYNRPQDSGITVTVEEGENNIPLELSSN